MRPVIAILIPLRKYVSANSAGLLKATQRMKSADCSVFLSCDLQQACNVLWQYRFAVHNVFLDLLLNALLRLLYSFIFSFLLY